MPNRKYFLLLLIVSSLLACQKDDPTAQLSISAFEFRSANNSGLPTDIKSIIQPDTIYAIFPSRTVLSSLVPSIAFTAQSISPADKTPQDFTNPVTYILTGADGSSRKYIVLAKTLPDTSATIYFNTVIGNESAYAKLYALDAGTGALKWKMPTTNYGNMASPNFSKGILYTSVWKKMLAIDVNTKSTLWEFLTGDLIYSTPTVVNGIVYFTSGGYVYAVDGVNGQQKWKYFTGIDGTNYGSHSNPTVVGGILYVGGADGAISAINAISGQIKWKYKDNSFASTVSSSPSVVNGVVYSGDNASNFIALNAGDGSLKWIKTGKYVGGAPHVVNGVIYIVSSGEQLYALDANTGNELWYCYLGYSPNSYPIVEGNTVYVSCDSGNRGIVYAINTSDGSVKWQYLDDTPSYSNPVVFNGNVYLGSTNSFSALDAKTGVLKWRVKTDWRYEYADDSAPCIVDNQQRVYQCARSGEVD